MNNIRESQSIPGFHSVNFFREVKEHIAAETKGMTFEQLKKYIAERSARASREKFERVEMQSKQA